MKMFENFKNAQTCPPNNRIKIYAQDHTDVIPIGGTAIHVFKVTCDLSRYCSKFEITYTQSLGIVLQLVGTFDSETGM